MKRVITLASIMFIALASGQDMYKAGDVRLSPRLLNYQGFVSDTLGNPINDTLDFLFRLYASSSGGTAIWSELQLDMVVTKGIFHAVLGSVIPLPDSVFTKSVNRWLELRIGGQTLSPRTQITASGYAFTATYSDTAEYARSAPAVDSCRISANSHKLQNKDTTNLDARYVNEGQTAAGVLAGTYPGPALADNAVTTLKILDTAVTMVKIARAGASSGQIIKWNGTAWQPANDTLGGADNDWLRGAGPLDTVLFTANFLGLARGGANNIIFGDSGHTVTNWGAACTTGRNAENHRYSTVGGGYGNCAEGNYSVIAGGQNNKTWANLGTIGGGFLNRVEYSGTVAGGYCNYASGMYATVSGGDYNRASGEHSVIAGGYADTATGQYSVIGGGQRNTANSDFATISGGAGNIASGVQSTVGGGIGNTASSTRTTVAGGGMNTASVLEATVGGGANNTASAIHATVSGGYYNLAAAFNSTVGGGYGDTTSGYAAGIFAGRSNLAGDAEADSGAAVCGGAHNHVTAKYGFIGGGINNSAGSNYSLVVGGDSNTVTAQNNAVIVGGHRNYNAGPNSFLGAGQYNSVTSNWGVVVGGFADTVRSGGSFIGGGYANKAFTNIGYGYQTICGGEHNSASGQDASIIGGYNNYAGCEGVNSYYQTVGGGSCDTAKAFAGGVFCGYSNIAGDTVYDTCATVCGGWNNSALAKYTFIGGGIGNSAGNLFATVAGGGSNNSSGFAATAAGGSGNVASGSWSTSSGGLGNEASGYGASVIGGGDNISSGIYSMAGGYCDSSSASYCFTAGNNSTVLSGHDNSAVFNGLSSTASGQTRVGALSKVSGTFTIDHPLDPEHKILNHYFVESPEMSNLYEGEVMLDAAGRAEVTLPDYFNALNRTPRIHLTGIGSSDVYVAEKVKDNRFVIGGKPGTEVYWMVTGSRKDPSAEITKILMPVEQVKEGGLAGRSLDDEFLVVTREQLERMGKADGFRFRHVSEANRYQEMKRMIEENRNE